MKAWIAGALAAIGVGNSVTAGEPTAHPIYRCETARGAVFSDRPCGASSEVYKPDLAGITVLDTVVPPPRPSQRAVPAAHRSSQSTLRPKADLCDSLDRSLNKIVSTMRAGYRASQGERLRERKRELEAKRRAQKC